MKVVNKLFCPILSCFTKSQFASRRGSKHSSLTTPLRSESFQHIRRGSPLVSSALKMEAENCYETMLFIYQIPSFHSSETHILSFLFFLAFFQIKAIYQYISFQQKIITISCFVARKCISIVCTEFVHVLSNSEINDDYHIMKSTL